MLTLSSTAVVNGTLWILVGFSVLSWSVILAKAWQQWSLARSTRAYLNAFWGTWDLGAATGLAINAGAAARLAQAGFQALEELATAAARDLGHSGDVQDLLERCLRQQLQRERRTMESGLAVLASIGSTAPFVGLFGTVWGIMQALQDISKSGSASLDVVAGPIGEALVATAIGIAVAVLAVLAYNLFLRRVKLCSADLEDFATDFLHLAIRNGLTIKRSTSDGVPQSLGATGDERDQRHTSGRRDAGFAGGLHRHRPAIDPGHADQSA